MAENKTANPATELNPSLRPVSVGKQVGEQRAQTSGSAETPRKSYTLKDAGDELRDLNHKIDVRLIKAVDTSLEAGESQTDLQTRTEHLLADAQQDDLNRRLTMARLELPLTDESKRELMTPAQKRFVSMADSLSSRHKKYVIDKAYAEFVVETIPSELVLERATEIKRDEQQPLVNLQSQIEKWGRYLDNKDQIEERREELMGEIAKGREAAKFAKDRGLRKVVVSDLERTVKNAERSLRRYERQNLPDALLTGELFVKPENAKNDVEKEYMEMEKRLIKLTNGEEVFVEKESKMKIEVKPVANPGANPVTNPETNPALNIKSEEIKKTPDEAVSNDGKGQQEGEKTTSEGQISEPKQATTDKTENVNAAVENPESKGLIGRVYERINNYAQNHPNFMGVALGTVETVAANTILAFPGGSLVVAGINFVSKYAIGKGYDIASGRASAEASAGKLSEVELKEKLDKYTNAKKYVNTLFTTATKTVALESLLYVGLVLTHNLIGNAPNLVFGQGGIHNPVAGGEGVLNPGHLDSTFFDQTVKVGGGHPFWSQFDVAGKYLAGGHDMGWVGGVGGNSQEDVIRSLVTQMARMDGHELGNLVNGAPQTVRIGDFFTGPLADQQKHILDLALKTTSADDYAKNVFPLWDQLLKSVAK